MTSSRNSGLPPVFSRSARRVAGEMSPTSLKTRRSSCSLSAPERLELDRSRAHAAAAPVGTNVEQLRPGQADIRSGLAHPVGHVLDQLEQGLLRPVDVLEDENQRLRLRHQLCPLARRPRDLLLAPLAVDRFEHAGGETEKIGDGIGRAARAELFDRDIERVVVGDVGRALDHLGERPVRDALAVRKAAPERIVVPSSDARNSFVSRVLPTPGSP